MSAELTTIPRSIRLPFAGELFLLGRLLFGVTLAFMGLNHFMDVDTMAATPSSRGSRRRASR